MYRSRTLQAQQRTLPPLSPSPRLARTTDSRRRKTTAATPSVAPKSIALTESHVASGALLYLENSEPMVEWWTGESISHVAILFWDAGRYWVYEAAPPRVRRVPLAEYYEELCRRIMHTTRRIATWLTLPKRRLTLLESAAARRVLNQQLGRTFSIKSGVHRRVDQGIHCGELAGKALQVCRGFPLDHYHTMNPADLMRKTSSFYHHPQLIRLEPYKPRRPWLPRVKKSLQETSSWIRWYAEEIWRLC